jgi:hypothetical protein
MLCPKYFYNYNPLKIVELYTLFVLKSDITCPDLSE